MKNKYRLICAALISSVGLFQCKSKNNVLPEVQVQGSNIDFNKGAIQIMDTMVNNLYGRWNLEHVEFDIKYLPATGSIKRDTTLTNFAILEVLNISRDEDKRYPTVKAQILFQNQVWPVAFKLYASDNRIVTHTGPHAFTLLDTQWPTGSHVWKQDEIFFRDLGLTGENYSIGIDYKARTMVWKGLNRDIKEIRMRRL